MNLDKESISEKITFCGVRGTGWGCSWGGGGVGVSSKQKKIQPKKK